MVDGLVPGHKRKPSLLRRILLNGRKDPRNSRLPRTIGRHPVEWSVAIATSLAFLDGLV